MVKRRGRGAVGVAAPGSRDAIGPRRQAGEGVSGEVRPVARFGKRVIVAIVNARLNGRAPDCRSLGEAGIAIIHDLYDGGDGNGADEIERERAGSRIIGAETDRTGISIDRGGIELNGEGGGRAGLQARAGKIGGQRKARGQRGQGSAQRQCRGAGVQDADSVLHGRARRCGAQ